LQPTPGKSRTLSKPGRHHSVPATHRYRQFYPRSVERRSRESTARISVANGIDKSQLVHPEPRRFRDRNHVEFVAKQPCLICGRSLPMPIICGLRSTARSGEK
jgi:hypothetical protein